MTTTDKTVFKIFYGKAKNIPIKRHNGYVYFTTDQRKLYIDAQKNGTIERTLINPDMTSKTIQSKTTEQWNADPLYISEKDILYIYSDYKQNNEGQTIPGIKIGDGKAYLIDLPFIDSLLMEHLNNLTIHITENQRSFWNAKIRCYLSQADTENIIFTTD